MMDDNTTNRITINKEELEELRRKAMQYERLDSYIGGLDACIDYIVRILQALNHREDE